MKKEEEGNEITVGSDGTLAENEVTAASVRSLDTDGLFGSVKQLKQMQYKAFAKFGKVYLGEPEGEKYDQKNTIDFYSEKGSKTEHLSFGIDGSQSQQLYNERGQLYELSNKYANGEVGSHSTLSYNEQGKQLEHKIYDGENKLIGRYEHTYNDRGQLLQQNQYGPDGKVNSNTTYTYDKNGKNIETKSVDVDGVSNSWTKSKFNKKGHMVEHSYLRADGTVRDVRKFYDNYDVNGDPIPPDPNIKHVPYKPKESLYVAKLEKDEKGNWIKKINFFGDLPINIFIREISYYGEEEKEIIQADTLFNLPINLSNAETVPFTMEELISIKVDAEMEEDKKFTPEETRWLADKGPSGDTFSYLGYYILKNNEFPSQTSYVSQDVDAIALLGELKSNMDAVVIHSYTLNYSDRNDKMLRYTLTFPQNEGYILHAMQIQQQSADAFEVPEFIEDYHSDGGEYVYLSQFILLHPNETSKMRDEYGFEETLKEYIVKCTVERIPDKPEIYMVEVTAKGEFQLQSHAVREDFEIDDLDIQYGYGFEKFHKELMGRFQRENQGLVLFHGIPGTGKTYYIRHLLKEMSEANKIVIYMPPNMVDYLVDPSFMTFLHQTVASHSEDGQFCVLLIEDAEPLLAARHTETRIQGVTNLLNMTDGLLNDMLKLQIICTFNVELQQLDAALLRPGRLIARKEFKALGEIEANLLAQSLGIKHHFTAPATLSEIYAKLKNKNTLIHDDY